MCIKDKDAVRKNRGTLFNNKKIILVILLSNVDFKDNKVAGFDVKALFTNVTIDGAMQAVDNIDSDELPVFKQITIN